MEKARAFVKIQLSLATFNGILIPLMILKILLIFAHPNQVLVHTTATLAASVPPNVKNIPTSQTAQSANQPILLNPFHIFPLEKFRIMSRPS